MNSLRSIANRSASCLALAFLVLFGTQIPDLGVGSAASQSDPGENPITQTNPEGVEAIAAHHSPFTSGPSFDSGWIFLEPGEERTLLHFLNLAPHNLFVTLDFNESGGITNRFVGGIDFGTQPYAGSAGDQMGAYWHDLDLNSIKVTRLQDDALVDLLRLRIWIVDEIPDYTSNWTVLTGSQLFYHYLGGNIDDYVVDIMFYDSPGTLGVHQFAYGGRDLGHGAFWTSDLRFGAYWSNLTNDHIYINRRSDDVSADSVLVRIWVVPQVVYDSGWVNIAQGQLITLNHDIGGNPEDYRVDLTFKAAGLGGLNQCYLGGNDLGDQASYPPGSVNDRVGAYWGGLDPSIIKVRRRQEDHCAEQVRVRIWNFWRPTQPDYDSSWQSIAAGSSLTLDHNLGGAIGLYLVDLQFKSTGLFNISVHQRALGGMDEDNGDRQGAYWDWLTSESIRIVRRPEDIQADRIRVRIWKMPKPSFDSGFTAIDVTVQPYHYLSGNPEDYMVDLEFACGIGDFHNQGFGGYDAIYLDANHDNRLGGYWRYLDENRAAVYKRQEETVITSVRLRIWTLSLPDYDSGIITTSTGYNNLNHNLGGSVDRYLINMLFLNDSDKVHQLFYGGNVFAGQPEMGHLPGDAVGADWRSLSSSQISLFRNSQDTYVPKARVRIWLLQQKIYLPIVVR